jgi:hypothetical protein
MGKDENANSFLLHFKILFKKCITFKILEMTQHILINNEIQF